MPPQVWVRGYGEKNMPDRADTQTTNELNDIDYARILGENLVSGVSILDEDMNYLFISDSVYDSINIERHELVPGDPLSKCHELMVANGMLTPELLEAQKLSPKDQIRRNMTGESEDSRLMTLGDGSTHRFIRKALPCGKTISIADNVSDLVEKEKLLDKALSLGEAGYWSLDVVTSNDQYLSLIHI